MRRGRSSGYSFAELLVVVAILVVVLAAAIPVLGQAADTVDAAAAARYVSALIARARFEAARQNRTVALRFTDTGGETWFSLAADGDGDGVSAADVAAGIDPVVRPPDRLSAHFRHARFGIAAATPGIEGGAPLTPGDDPIRLGVARQLSVSAVGSATSGTIYLASSRGAQFAVRIAGVTGRVRVLRYRPGTSLWTPY